MSTSRGRRAALTVFLSLAVAAAAAIMVACGDDSEPAPAATATQPPPTATPTATQPPPTATPSPSTATPAATAVAQASMRDFVIGAATTGSDLIERLSDEEAACIKSLVGDAAWELMLGVPLMSAGTDTGAAQPLLACLTGDNVVLLGTALIDAQAGGRAAETRQCIIELGLEHPEVLYVRLGWEWPGGTAPHEIHAYLTDYYRCMAPEEKVAFAVQLSAGLAAANPVTGRDFVESLAEDEVACLREFIGEERWEPFLNVQLVPGGRGNRGALLEACFGEAGTGRLFAHVFAARLGGFSEPTFECVLDFTQDYPRAVALFSGDAAAVRALSAEEFVTVASDVQWLFDCLNGREHARLHQTLPAALSSP